MICDTIKDMTATGPIETSLEVAKNWKKIRMLYYARKSPAYAVNQGANKRRVQAVFSRKCSDDGVGHGLRHCDDADGNTSNEVTGQPCQVVAPNPMDDGEQTIQVLANLNSEISVMSYTT
jgi:hypothetical protein